MAALRGFLVAADGMVDGRLTHPESVGKSSLLAIALGILGAAPAAEEVEVTAPPFNSRCDGQADDRDALQAALDTGKTVLLPAAGRVCVTTGSLRLKD
jgi:hypothetical protein